VRNLEKTNGFKNDAFLPPANGSQLAGLPLVPFLTTSPLPGVPYPNFGTINSPPVGSSPLLVQTDIVGEGPWYTNRSFVEPNTFTPVVPSDVISSFRTGFFWVLAPPDYEPFSGSASQRSAGEPDLPAVQTNLKPVLQRPWFK
jgi:hypothetical protein